jgi:Uma2 family endonuclease
MTDLPKHKMTADEFLIWAEDLPKEAGIFELWDGDVVLRHGPGFEDSELAEHWDVKGAMYRALHDAIARAGLPCFAAVDGPVVRLSPRRMARPDVLVHCGPKLRGTREATNPTILVEVLSPSTRKRDHGVKLEGYFTLPSLAHYLIIDPDRRLLIHHRRGAVEPPAIVKGPRLRLDPPGLDVDLTEVLAD